MLAFWHKPKMLNTMSEPHEKPLFQAEQVAVGQGESEGIERRAERERAERRQKTKGRGPFTVS